MSFIISKLSIKYGKTQTLYYLVSNYRVGNKIKRKTLLRLNTCTSLNEYSQLVDRREIKLLKELARSCIMLEDCEKYNKKPITWASTKPLLIWKLRRDIHKIKTKLSDCQNEKAKVNSYIHSSNS